MRDFLTWAGDVLRTTMATMRGGEPLKLDRAINSVRAVAYSIAGVGGQTIFIGNGGAAATGMHMAIDWSLAGMRSIALTDGVSLSSHANDYGVEEMFAKQLELLGTMRTPNLLVAMSCSGRSKNILRAAEYAKSAGMGIVTFSGFDASNDLRQLGDVNFYTGERRVGFVQLAHFALLHAVCDQKE